MCSVFFIHTNVPYLYGSRNGARVSNRERPRVLAAEFEDVR
jgi:hypothetical protein